MARTQQTQRPDTPRSSTSRSGRPVPRRAVLGLVASLVTAAWALMMVTSAGHVVYAYLFVFTEFYAGVATLVLLSLTVMAGLLATDRIVLLIRHRVLLQSGHRAMGVIAVGALTLHILTKIVEGHASLLDPVLPFVSGRGLFVGLGTVAGYAMVSVLWTGLIRMRFAGSGRPWMWRALHSIAYASWPVALLHGLNAGRSPAGWVTLSYLVCVLLVIAALLVRLSVSVGRKRRESTQSTPSARPAGAGADPAADGSRRWSRRREPVEVQADRKLAGWAASLRGGTSEMADSWAAPGEYRPVGSPRRRSDRFVVPPVPTRRNGEEEIAPRRPAAQEPAAGWPERDRYADEPARPPADRDRYPGDPARTAANRQRYADEVARPAAEHDRYPVAGDRYPADVGPLPADGDRDRPDRQWWTDRRPAVEPDPVDRGGSDWGRAAVYQPSVPEEPWDSPRRWTGSDRSAAATYTSRAAEVTTAVPDTSGDNYWESPSGWRSGDERPEGARVPGPRHGRTDDLREVGYAPPPPDDETPTLVDLASRRALRAAEGGSSRSRRRRNADAVDSAYWSRLRGEAQ